MVPRGVSITFRDGVCTVQGPRGALSRKMPWDVEGMFDAEKREARVVPAKHTRRSSALTGTWYAHVRNMVTGVTDGFSKVLVFEGVGYRAVREGADLVLSLGFSHPVRLSVPSATDVMVEKNEIRVAGTDKELVGQTAATIRACKVPEPYKGKGIRYQDEIIRRKAGKKAGVGG